LLPLSSSVQNNFDATQHAELILKLHATTKDNLEHMNVKYKVVGDRERKHVVFEVGDLVWLHSRKDCFPDLRKSKLMPRADGPFKVIEKINSNAYKLELPEDFGTVSPTFNIADLKPYFGEEDKIGSRMTSVQEGEHDEDIPSIGTPAAPIVEHIQGHTTQARAKQLNYQVLSFLGTLSYITENMMLPKSDVFVTLMNDGPSMDKRDKHGDGSQHERIEEDAASEDFRTLKPP
jgi:hypothetical protein